MKTRGFFSELVFSDNDVYASQKRLFVISIVHSKIYIVLRYTHGHTQIK